MPVYDQQWQRFLVACCGQPSGSIEKADPVNVHLLALRRLGHHQAGQVVNQCEDDKFFEVSLDHFILKNIEAQGGLQLGEIRFNVPPGSIDLGQGFNEIVYRIEDGGDEGNRCDPKAFSVPGVWQCSGLQALGQVLTLLCVHPLRTGEGLQPVGELGMFPALLEPGGTWLTLMTLAPCARLRDRRGLLIAGMRGCVGLLAQLSGELFFSQPLVNGATVLCGAVDKRL